MEAIIQGVIIAWYVILTCVFIRLGSILDELRDINKKLERDDEKSV